MEPILTDNFAASPAGTSSATARVGLGTIALASLLRRTSAPPRAAAGRRRPDRPASRHFPPKAKNVIYLFMAGGPSQLELFDYKPKLVELQRPADPRVVHRGQALRLHGHVRFKERAEAARAPGGSSRSTARAARGCRELFPHTADDRRRHRARPDACATDVFNHAPAKLFMNTGSPQFGRPSMGSWVTYGIGSESQDLPGFVVLQSGPRGPRGGAVNWGSGFLPDQLPGRAVPLQRRADREPRQPRRASPPTASATRSTPSRDLNLKRLDATGDPEIATRIAAYEMAYRMQTSAPELIDLSGETQATLDAVRRRAGQAVVRQQLPARPPARRARRALRAALPHRLGPPRRPRREPREATSKSVCREVDQGAGRAGART